MPSDSYDLIEIRSPFGEPVVMPSEFHAEHRPSFPYTMEWDLGHDDRTVTTTVRRTPVEEIAAQLKQFAQARIDEEQAKAMASLKAILAIDGKPYKFSDTNLAIMQGKIAAWESKVAPRSDYETD